MYAYIYIYTYSNFCIAHALFFCEITLSSTCSGKWWNGTEFSWRFPARHGGYPNSWLVYFMENPNLQWMMI